MRDDKAVSELGTTTYVVGFLFHANWVALIRKNRPAWQNGLLNGVGGHIELEESIFAAMRREFREETELDVENWQHFATIRFGFPDDMVYFFRHHSTSPSRPLLKQPTDEAVEWYSMETVLRRPDINPHLKYLLPLAIHTDEVSMRKRSFMESDQKHY